MVNQIVEEVLKDVRTTETLSRLILLMSLIIKLFRLFEVHVVNNYYSGLVVFYTILYYIQSNPS